MSRVWRCQSCNGNCDKGQQGGNAVRREGRREKRRGEDGGSNLKKLLSSTFDIFHGNWHTWREWKYGPRRLLQFCPIFVWFIFLVALFEGTEFTELVSESGSYPFQWNVLHPS